VIFESDFNTDSLIFNGIGIGQNLTTLPSDSVTEYYDASGNNGGVKIKDGWVLTDNGIQYVLKKGIVDFVRIKRNGIDQLTELEPDDVVKLIGPPAKTSTDSVTYVFDLVIIAKIYHYTRKKLNIHFSNDDKKICELEIGRKNWLQQRLYRSGRFRYKN